MSKCKLKHLSSVLVLTGLLLSSKLNAQAFDQKLEPSQDKQINFILDHLAKALGGREALRKIENVHTLTEIEYGGLKGTEESWNTADGRTKTSVTIGSVYSALTIYTGGRGWVRDKNGKVAELAGNNLMEAISAAYMSSYSYLLADRMPGQVQYVGEDQTKQHHILRMTPQGGQPITYYLDKATYLPLKQEQPSAERISVTYFSDWREINGVKMPYRLRQSTGDPKFDSLFTVKLVRFNTELDKTAFEKPTEAAPDFHFARGRQALNIPLTLTGSNHILIQAKINNSEAGWFFVDSGAGVSLVNYRWAKEQGWPLEGKFEARGIGDKSVETAFVKGVSISLPGVEVSKQTLAAIPLESIERAMGRSIHGIVGYDFFSRFVVEIDYAAAKLNLYDPKTYQYAGPGQFISTTLEDNLVHIQGQVVVGNQSIAGKFAIDTGSGDTLDLTTPFVDQHKLLDVTKKVIQSSSGGIGGRSKELKGRIGEVKIGSFSIKDPIVTFSRAEKGKLADPDIAGNLGGGLLKRFKVIFDYDHQRMILEKNSKFDEPFTTNLSGLVLIAEGSGYQQIKVEGVEADSPAAEAGITQGDEILEVNQRPSAQLTLEEIQRMFKQAGEFDLKISREGKVQKVTLKLHQSI